MHIQRRKPRAKSQRNTSRPQGCFHGSYTHSGRTTTDWSPGQTESRSSTSWSLLIIDYAPPRGWRQSYEQQESEIHQFIPRFYFVRLQSPLLLLTVRLRKWDFAMRPSILYWPHEDVSLCQEAELGRPAGAPGGLLAFVWGCGRNLAPARGQRHKIILP